MKRWLVLFLLAAFFSGNARAADPLAATAAAAWEKRADVTQALLAVDLYHRLAAADPKDFDSRLRVARGVYWILAELETPLDKDEKLRLYEQAIQGCNEIIARDENSAGAWNWLMWNMGAYTLERGIFSGWNLREAIVGTIMIAKTDVNYDFGGVYRHWARVIFETPGLMGRFLHFTDDDSIWLYKKAIAVDPKYAQNHFFLGETYEKIGRPAEAKKEFDFCAALPDDALPDRVPETQLYKKMAAEKLKKL